MTSAHGVEGSSYRWPMLAVVSLGIVALTLNWFDVATAFPLIGAEFKVGLGSLSLLISLYIVGYGLTHIPGGVLATKIGMKRALVLGLLVQGAAGVMSGLSHSYVELAIFRIVPLAMPRRKGPIMNSRTNKSQEPRLLRRPADGRILGGVAAGLARYFAIDVTHVRIILVALSFLGGATVPLYLAAWVLIPAEGSDITIADEVLNHAGSY